MLSNPNNSPQAKAILQQSELNFGDELTEIEQESLSGGKKIEVIIRPFKLDPASVSVARQYGIRSIPTLMYNKE
ncbi:MAG TPA: hypothetical protein DDZ80_10325 [Cyanobacteria bacterium UBA8803]|nr:hypothetical protein [Cyanobacteria bacterium UBA9273]HBL58888.1 hypothetical protein [Cyanobacteria bacterium UBA8803]